MIDLEFIEALIRAVDESGVDSIEIERGGTRIRVSKSPSVVNTGGAPAPAPPPAPAAGPSGSPGGGGTAAPPAGADAAAEAPEEEEGLIDVTSPMVGTFYRAPSPDSEPYVEVGDSVSDGDTLCIIEAMKLMNELECEVKGTVAEILAEDAEPVEYGQVLFKIRPAG